MTKALATADVEVADARSIREANVEAFLDAAERLLVREGAAGISTRQLAREAGQNHGLVHYYFGSVDELLLQTLERFTGREGTRGRFVAQCAKHVVAVVDGVVHDDGRPDGERSGSAAGCGPDAG